MRQHSRQDFEFSMQDTEPRMRKGSTRNWLSDCLLNSFIIESHTYTHWQQTCVTLLKMSNLHISHTRTCTDTKFYLWHATTLCATHFSLALNYWTPRCCLLWRNFNLSSLCFLLLHCCCYFCCLFFRRVDLVKWQNNLLCHQTFNT